MRRSLHCGPSYPSAFPERGFGNGITRGLAYVLPDETQSTRRSRRWVPTGHPHPLTCGARPMPDGRSTSCSIHCGMVDASACSMSSMIQLGGLGDRSGLESPSGPRHPHLKTHRSLAWLPRQTSFGQWPGVWRISLGRVGRAYMRCSGFH